MTSRAATGQSAAATQRRNQRRPAELYAAMGTANIQALWTQAADLMPDQPAPRAVPWLWPWETVLALAGPGSGLPCVVQISHLGGALAAEPAVPSVVGHRDARYALRVLSRLDPGGGAEQAPALRPRHERVYTALGEIGRASCRKEC